MSIAETTKKCKYFVNEYVGDEVFIVALVLLVGVGGFGLGRLSFIDDEQRKTPISIEYADMEPAAAGESAAAAWASGAYVASKNSDKYHLPWCSGAVRISEENKIWFASKEEAEAAGYTPAGNCKGI